MRKLFGESTREEESEWLSVSDLMAGLMIVFLFIAIAFIEPFVRQNQIVKQILATWQENQLEIYQKLEEEFRNDLPRWNAEIDRNTLLFRFKAPDVLFEDGRATIRPRFATILQDFFPRYLRVLEQYKESIEEIRIEGHTSSAWNPGTPRDEAYFLNMELSQARTRAVLQHILTLPAVADKRGWLLPHLTANGLSSSRPITDANRVEDAERSRRVEFRIRTKERAEIVKILEELRRDR